METVCGHIRLFVLDTNYDKTAKSRNIINPVSAKK